MILLVKSIYQLIIIFFSPVHFIDRLSFGNGKQMLNDDFKVARPEIVRDIGEHRQNLTEEFGDLKEMNYCGDSS